MTSTSWSPPETEMLKLAPAEFTPENALTPDPWASEEQLPRSDDVAASLIRLDCPNLFCVWLQGYSYTVWGIRLFKRFYKMILVFPFQSMVCTGSIAGQLQYPSGWPVNYF